MTYIVGGRLRPRRTSWSGVAAKKEAGGDAGADLETRPTLADEPREDTWVRSQYGRCPDHFRGDLGDYADPEVSRASPTEVEIRVVALRAAAGHVCGAGG